MSDSAASRWLLPPPLRGLRASFIFFTRIPVGGFPFRKEDFRWAAAHAPLVGLVLGGVTGGVYRALLPLGGLSAAALALGLSMLLTGAFHEDGLADTSDALGGGFDREKVLAILKDSRIGSFGGAALAVSVLARAALVSQQGAAGAWALPLAFCAARVGPIWQMAALPYVTPDGAARSRDLTRGGFLQASVAALWLVAACTAAVRLGLVTSQRALAMILVLAALTLLTAFRYVRRVGGIAGDFLGATEQLGEIAALAALAWAVS